MSQVVNIDIFSRSSVENAIKQLDNYRKSLDNKCARFVKQLAEVGLPIIDERINQAGFTLDENGIESGAETKHDTHIKIRSFGDYSEATLVVEGEDLLFIEFGAGVYYNGQAGGSPHPYGEKMGYRIGYYGQGKGKQKIWGYYADGGELVLTHGVKATMPVYSAWQEMYKKIDQIAKEVFGGNG